jgi:hypothetical protein
MFVMKLWTSCSPERRGVAMVPFQGMPLVIGMQRNVCRRRSIVLNGEGHALYFTRPKPKETF